MWSCFGRHGGKGSGVGGFGKELKGYMVGGDRSDMLRVMPCTSLIVRIRLFCGFLIVKVW